MKVRNFIKLTSCAAIICVLAILLVTLFSANNYALAEENDPYNDVFEQIIDELGVGTITYTRTIINDIDGKPLGYAYDYVYSDGEEGYAILINTQSGITTTELSTASPCPYGGISGQAIYISEFNYWEKNGDVYTSLTDGYTLSYEELNEIYLNRYGAIGDSLTSGTETITYKSKEEDSYSLALKIPAYNSRNKGNVCVPIAAANIFIYFDKDYVNLIPNYTPGVSIIGLYGFNASCPVMDDIVAELCVDMNTDYELGTTIEDCKQGMKAFCNRKGYQIEYETCMSGGLLDYNKAKTVLEDKRLPIILFASKIELIKISEEKEHDDYSLLTGKVMHALDVFGYNEITYTLNNGTKKVMRFLHVASGISRMSEAYLNMDNNLTIDDAYVVNIK